MAKGANPHGSHPQLPPPKRKYSALYHCNPLIPSITTKLILLRLLPVLLLLVPETAPQQKKLKEQDIIQRVLKNYDWRVSSG